MKNNKDVIKFINQTRKKNNYHWDKEGEELLQKIASSKADKNELKNTLSLLLLTEEIPIDFVPRLWLTSARIEENINNNKQQYQKLVKAFDILIKNRHPLYLYMKNKISYDLNRSFNPNKVKATEENINQLKNILYAFTVRNVTLNYCQGYNTIASFFLQITNFKEEESFYLFLRLMEEILPYDYYLFGIGIEAETFILNKLIEEYEPEIINHLSKKEGGDLILYGILTQFITSLFSFKMDQNITIFFFNCLFGFYSLEETKNIFFYFYKIILAIFHSFKKEILKCKTDKKINELLNFDKLPKEKIQCIIYYTLFDESLDISYVKKIREENVNKIIQEKNIKFKYNNENNLECNINYPICIEEYDVKSKLYLNNYYRKGINIKNNNKTNNIIINSEDDDESILRDIIIERRPHFCQVKLIKKKYNYSWEKEGNEIFTQINNNPNNLDKKKLKEMLSLLFLTQNIPKNLISTLWQSCTQLPEILNKNKGQYTKLLKAFDILIKNKHPFYIYIQKKISLDLNRTFSKEKLFQIPKNIDILKNVLYAFTVRNVSINYCQGLNTIVGHLLKMMDFKEEETFYLFLILLEKILPHDYYLFSIGVEADLNIIKLLLDKYEPDLMEHLKKINCDLILFGVFTQFITSLFTFKINESITNILFNCFFGFYFLEDDLNNLFFYFYKIIIGIFRAFKEDLYRIKDMKEFYNSFNIEKEQSKEYIENIIYYSLFENENENNFDLNEVKNIRQYEINKLLEKKKTKFNFNNEEGVKCNINYPLCIEECNISSPIELKVSYEKIKTEESNDKNEIVINNEENDENILQDIIIERRKHYCQK